MTSPPCSIRHRLGAALVLATLVSCVAAQPLETPPTPAAPRPLRIAAPVEQALPNGLRVVVARRAGIPLVTAELVVLSGSEADPARRAGLASMTAELLTQGTRRHSAPQLAAAAEALGGSLNSGAGWNRSIVSMTVTTPRLDAALGLVAEVATEPTFAVAELDRLRTQTLDQLKVTYASPAALAALAAERLVYGSGAYGHPATGTPASLARITRGDLVALHRATFRPDNAVLVLAGDIEPGTALALAQKHFARWAAPPTPKPVADASIDGKATDAPVVVIDMPGSGQAGVVLALAVPPRRGDERAIGSVMNAVLGGGYSSRLNQEIRIRRGLSYGAGSGLDPRRQGALFRASVQTKNESAADVIGLLEAEVDRLMAERVDPDELAARKAALIGDFSRSVETTSGLAAAVAGLVVAGLPIAELQTRIETLATIDADQVQRYAAAHLGRDLRRIVVAGEAARFVDALRARAARVAVVKAADLDLERDGLSGR